MYRIKNGVLQLYISCSDVWKETNITYNNVIDYDFKEYEEPIDGTWR